jgi:N-carbamoyl-L-amino-acid hydrolase
MQVQDSTPGVAALGLRVDGARLWDSLMRLAQIGATANGGVCRLALTERDRDARNLFVGWAKEIGCTVRIDAIGNIFARRAGARRPAARDDGQPYRHAADRRQVRRQLRRARGPRSAAHARRRGVRTRAPLEVAVWTNEEGSRFVPVMMGSGVFARAFTLEHALAQRDRDGVAVRDALAAIGYGGRARCASGRRVLRSAYRTGPVLEAHATTIGVVEARSGSAGTTSPCTGWRRTPARRRWRCGATRCWWRPISCAR